MRVTAMYFVWGAAWGSNCPSTVSMDLGHHEKMAVDALSSLFMGALRANSVPSAAPTPHPTTALR